MPELTPPAVEPTIDRRGRIASVALAAALASMWLLPGGSVDENRTVPDFPGLSDGGWASADAFRRVDDALVARLPIKGATVDFVGSAFLALNFSPNTNVVLGSAGEPFYAGDFTAPCLSSPRFAFELESGLAAAQEHLASGSTYFLFAVVPDKSSIERAALGSPGAPLLQCSDQNREVMEGLFAHRGSPGLGAWDELGDAHAAGERVYLFGDSHWNPYGAAIFTKLLLDRLAADGEAPPGLSNEIEFDSLGSPVMTGDLFRMLGEDREEEVALITPKRDSVTTTTETQPHPSGYQIQRWVSESGSAPLIQGRTLILHDSAFALNASILAPFFEDMTSVPLLIMDDPGRLGTLGRYDRVIVQQVQRNVPFNVGAIPQAAWF